tara:strand:+ start:2138 stop:2824 length:687 start_codon:yes stop_codon:yes gene_type:complete
MKIDYIMPKKIYKSNYNNSCAEISNYIRQEIMHNHNTAIKRRINPDTNAGMIIYPEDLPESFWQFFHNSFTDVLNTEQLIYNDYVIESQWINHQQEGVEVEAHSHPNCMFAANFYLDVMPPNNVIMFHNADQPFRSFHAIATKDMRIFDEEVIEYKVASGDLIFFRSDLTHSVPMVLGHGMERLSIVFNIRLTGIGFAGSGTQGVNTGSEEYARYSTHNRGFSNFIKD